MGKLTGIKYRNELFNLLEIPKQTMTFLLYNKEKKGTENSYLTFEIEKKNGGKRVINAPNKELKFVQSKLASLIWETQDKNRLQQRVTSNISHAFEKDKSIITNASIHRNKKFVLNVDLEDFFNSFHFGRVMGFFEKDKNFKVSREVAVVISQLVCYQGVLPQGAPTSPIITNLICKILDFRLLKLAKKYKLDYSRYADDLTFSTNKQNFLSDKEDFLLKLEEEIERAGFSINISKTRFQHNSSRQVVTGLTVNKKLSVPKEYYKNTRAMANNLYKKGYFFIDHKIGTMDQLEGRFAFINQIDKYNNSLEDNNSLIKNSINHQKNLLKTKRKENDHYKMLMQLNAREREYQKFLYYKYFYGNDRPTIVTEGKTDIRYLRAALKNLYKEYPNLIEKKGDNYIFKVFFFKKSKQKKTKRVSRYRYFFNLPIDGADSMKNLYNFFCDKDDVLYPNYLKYFNSRNSNGPTNPTIFIFDNELIGDKKPLRNFISHVYNKKKSDTKTNQIEKLKNELFLRIADNLYIVTNQLIENDVENEMEDLFYPPTLAHQIEGKNFSKKDVGDSKYRYGKEIFSKYVSENFENINFENFRPILNNINYIISEYRK